VGAKERERERERGVSGLNRRSHRLYLPSNEIARPLCERVAQ